MTTNYQLIKQIKKPEVHVPFEKIAEVKEVILAELLKNKEYWTKLNKKQLGVEKIILMSKVTKIVKVGSDIFYLALDELDAEQRVIPTYLDGMTRYIVF